MNSNIIIEIESNSYMLPPDTKPEDAFKVLQILNGSCRVDTCHLADYTRKILVVNEPSEVAMRHTKSAEQMTRDEYNKAREEEKNGGAK